MTRAHSLCTYIERAHTHSRHLITAAHGCCEEAGRTTGNVKSKSSHLSGRKSLQ